MRIAFVSSHALLGGSERYLATLLANLDPEWIAGIVILDEGPFVELARSWGHPVEVLSTGGHPHNLVAGSVRLRRALSALEPELVHANGVKAALMAGLGLVGTSTPVLWLKHDLSWDGRLARLILRRCERVVGVSAAVTATFGPHERVHVVHTGMDYPAPDRAAGRKALEGILGSPPTSVIGLVGRLHPVKGHLELLTAMTTVLQAHPDARLVFIGGDDPNQLEHARLVRDRARALGDAVVFTGHRSDARTLMSGFDVGVIPSVVDDRGMGKEGFPLVGLELMGAGIPIAGYADGGLPELVGDCGVLVSPNDRGALADSLIRLLADANERTRLSLCGQTRAREEFTVGRMTEALKSHYRAAAGR